MLVLIVYDINTTSIGGQQRLRNVAKLCEKRGRRVQNSVFECLLDAAQLRAMQTELKALINPALDSLRFYNLGNRFESRIEKTGQCVLTCHTGPLVF